VKTFLFAIIKRIVVKSHFLLLHLLLSTKVGSNSGIQYDIDPSTSIKIPPCDSKIYCVGGPGTLLHTIQMARIYNDSKTFVDKPLKHGPNQTLDNFKFFMQKHNHKPSKEDVKEFIDDNFFEEGTEFRKWIPTDWKSNIPAFDNIKDPAYKAFAQSLHRKWLSLGKKIRPDVKVNPFSYSLIYLENPFIIPGGRFRECYYWDSYWTILGLLASEMNETVKGMLYNFSTLVSMYGMIPNGNRVYFTRRSQPPLFISMINAYYEKTKDLSTVKDLIQMMENEFMFWIENRMTTISINDEVHTLAHYTSNVSYPRPESYYEDFSDAQHFFFDEEDRDNFYAEMKAGAESGWDYSSKWFISPSGEVSLHLKDIHTKDIIPVELNAFICANARILSKFYSLLNRFEKAQQFTDWSNTLRFSIDAVFWNEEHGIWFDYDRRSKKPRTAFYPSNIVPLWAECYPQTRMQEKIRPVMKYLEDKSLFEYRGGIPTSFQQSAQQWDSSNAWPPLQHLVITGLMKSREKSAQQFALNLISKWLRSNYIGYVQTNGTMFEKYDAKKIGVPGHAGEYIVQEGFGWTNGVILYLLSEYGDIINSKDQTIYEYHKSIEIENFWRFLLLLLMLGSIAFIINILKKKRFHIILIPAVALSNIFKYYRL